MVINSLIVGSDASHTDGRAKGRPGVLVYGVQLENGEDAVAKIPSRDSLSYKEVRLKRPEVCPTPNHVNFADPQAFSSGLYHDDAAI